MIKRLVMPFICGALFSQCVLAEQLVLTKKVEQPKIPSASGAVLAHGKLMVVADDAPFLYQVDHGLNVLSKKTLDAYPSQKDGRIAKVDKPDFEAMDTIMFHKQPAYIILGSGSKKMTREFGFLLTANNHLKLSVNLAPLYQQLAKAGKLTAKQHLNIEAMASNRKEVFLFNRGNSGANLIFSLDKQAFLDYFLGDVTKLPQITTYQVRLPKIKGNTSTFSGADYHLASDQLIVSASVEQTGNAIDDGKVLGSFLIQIPRKSLHADRINDLTKRASLLMQNGKPVLTKVEAVALKPGKSRRIDGVLASDNDTGVSEFFEFQYQK